MEEKGEVGEYGNWCCASCEEKKRGRICSLEGEVEMEWPRKGREEGEMGWGNGDEYRCGSWWRRIALMRRGGWAGIQSRLGSACNDREIGVLRIVNCLRNPVGKGLYKHNGKSRG